MHVLPENSDCIYSDKTALHCTQTAPTLKKNYYCLDYVTMSLSRILSTVTVSTWCTNNYLLSACGQCEDNRVCGADSSHSSTSSSQQCGCWVTSSTSLQGKADLSTVGGTALPSPPLPCAPGGPPTQRNCLPITSVSATITGLPITRSPLRARPACLDTSAKGGGLFSANGVANTETVYSSKKF